MTSLTKTKTLFGFTSPRTIQKIIPEIELLIAEFQDKKWSGNDELQADFFKKLYNSEFYEGDKLPKNLSLAARDRITRAPKAFGFVDLKPTIDLSAAGKSLLTGRRQGEIFTRQMMKFQLPSPFHTKSTKTDFNVRPYLELLRLIYDLGSLSKTEIALFFLQLTNYNLYDEILQRITSFRKSYKEYKGNKKTYIDETHEKIIHEVFYDEINSKKLKTRESNDTSLQKFLKTKKANMRDYADAFSRYIRATELVTFEKSTLRLIISSQKIEEVEFLLNSVPRNAQSFKSTMDFKNYLFDPDCINLLSDNKVLLVEKLTKMGITDIPDDLEIEKLKDLLEDINQTVKEENIQKKAEKLKKYEDYEDIIDIFNKIKTKDVPDPSLFLEWNVWRAFVMLNHAVRVDGNFQLDIDGMPLNTAPGGVADIEIEFEDFGIIVEVTRSSGETQFKMEGDSVPRHYGNFKNTINKDAYCIFLAPKISDGCKGFFFNLNKSNTKVYGGTTRIVPLSLDKFIEFIRVGVASKFSNPTLLKSWLDSQLTHNQTAEDEDIWFNKISSNVPNWIS